MKHAGAAGWAGVALVVAVADNLSDRTMSDMFRTAARHPRYAVPVAVTWVLLTAHLYGAIPPRYDPFVVLIPRRGRGSDPRYIAARTSRKTPSTWGNG